MTNLRWVTFVFGLSVLMEAQGFTVPSMPRDGAELNADEWEEPSLIIETITIPDSIDTIPSGISPTTICFTSNLFDDHRKTNVMLSIKDSQSDYSNWFGAIAPIGTTQRCCLKDVSITDIIGSSTSPITIRITIYSSDGHRASNSSSFQKTDVDSLPQCNEAKYLKANLLRVSCLDGTTISDNQMLVQGIAEIPHSLHSILGSEHPGVNYFLLNGDQPTEGEMVLICNVLGGPLSQGDENVKICKQIADLVIPTEYVQIESEVLDYGTTGDKTDATLSINLGSSDSNLEYEIVIVHSDEMHAVKNTQYTFSDFQPLQKVYYVLYDGSKSHNGTIIGYDLKLFQLSESILAASWIIGEQMYNPYILSYTDDDSTYSEVSIHCNAGDSSCSGYLEADSTRTFTVTLSPNVGDVTQNITSHVVETPEMSTK